MKQLQIIINTRTGDIVAKSLFEEHIRQEHIYWLEKIWGPSTRLIHQEFHIHNENEMGTLQQA